uniref:Uncharacterized protein n=1 Tax=Arundo donax TaxID=35708 RepID=A0A0A9BUM0_ARUDO
MTLLTFPPCCSICFSISKLLTHSSHMSSKTIRYLLVGSILFNCSIMDCKSPFLGVIYLSLVSLPVLLLAFDSIISPILGKSKFLDTKTHTRRSKILALMSEKTAWASVVLPRPPSPTIGMIEICSSASLFNSSFITFSFWVSLPIIPVSMSSLVHATVA